jgi:ribosome biogenesis GTPase
MTASTTLIALGWHPVFATRFAAHEAAGRFPARVLAEERGKYLVHDGIRTLPAAISGRFRHETSGDPLAFPTVGDWVAATPGRGDGNAVIDALLPRRSVIVRRPPVDHSGPAQAIAANIDVVFIVTSLNAEFNVRRLERYLAVAWESGALPVVVLSKSDLDDAAEARLAEAVSVAPGVEVIVASALTGEGIAPVRAHLAPGRTVVFIGSSGVGKSTLVNSLAGYELLTTAGIRDDDARGRHTTTRRQLVSLADGLVIDTPGMRELGLSDGDGLASTFADVERIAEGCRFSDCGHVSEPGCAIRVALAAGELDPDRLEAFRKLGHEARRAEVARDVAARRANRRTSRAIASGAERNVRQQDGGDR